MAVDHTAFQLPANGYFDNSNVGYRAALFTYAECNVRHENHHPPKGVSAGDLVLIRERAFGVMLGIALMLALPDHPDLIVDGTMVGANHRELWAATGRDFDVYIDWLMDDNNHKEQG